MVIKSTARAPESFYLDPITKPRKERKIAVYDIETTTDLTRVYLVGFFDGETYRYWESAPMLPEEKGSAIDQFCEWLFHSGRKYTHNKRQFWLYAHNGGNFDVLYLIKWLLSQPGDNWTFTATPVQSSVLALDVRNKNVTKPNVWQFLDSYRLMNASLEKLGKAYGLGGKVPHVDYATLHLDPRRYEYLERDCRLLHACLVRFYAMITNAGGDVGMTAPATAMLTWRRQHLDRRICRNKHFPECESDIVRKDHCEGCLHAFIRRAYYGGRVEVFTREFDGPGTVNLFDFNSMYPAAMLREVPTDFSHTKDGWVDVFSPFLGFVEAEVEVPPATYLPPIPHRHKEKLLFPAGRFRGVWSSIELQRLISKPCNGRIRKFGRSVWFRGQPVFADFVRSWYRWRDKSRADYTEAMDFCAKLLLNSLYGKTGMSEQREKIWFSPTEDDFKNHELRALSDNPRFGFIESVRVTAAYIVPQLAAWITAAARCQLYDAMQAAITSGCKIWYCDTDSIVTNASLPTSNELGALKLEAIATKAHFAAPKLYYMETTQSDRVKMKGFSGGFGSGLLTKERYLDIVQRSGVQVTNRAVKLRQGIRNVEQFPRMMSQEKSLNTIVDKRTFFHNGESIPKVIYEE